MKKLLQLLFQEVCEDIDPGAMEILLGVNREPFLEQLRSILYDYSNLALKDGFLCYFAPEVITEKDLYEWKKRFHSVSDSLNCDDLIDSIVGERRIGRPNIFTAISPITTEQVLTEMNKRTQSKPANLAQLLWANYEVKYDEKISELIALGSRYEGEYNYPTIIRDSTMTDMTGFVSKDLTLIKGMEVWPAGSKFLSIEY